MCGIVAAAAEREVSEILLEGLRRLEYRGYDSAGMALIDTDHALQLHKYSGKVKRLKTLMRLILLSGAAVSRIPGGRLTASRPLRMRIHIYRATALRWFTMASLRTMPAFAMPCALRVQSFGQRPIPRLLFT